MMHDIIIDRYVYDITRRLPKNERAEVEMVLTADIYDMLAGRQGEEDIIAVLQELGAPAALAEKYRRTPRYLISPAVYGQYTRVLKLAVPLAGVTLALMGMILGAYNMAGGSPAVPAFIGDILFGAVLFGGSGVFIAALFITAGFIIAERAGYRPGAKAWTPAKLPLIPIDDTRKKFRSLGIIEFGIIFYLCTYIFVCYKGFQVLYAIGGDFGNIIEKVTYEFIDACIPAAVAIAALAFAACAVKLIICRWTPVLCAAVVMTSLAIEGVFLYWLAALPVYTPEYIDMVRRHARNLLDAVPKSVQIVGAVSLLVLANCAWAIYRTVKAASVRKQAAKGDESHV